MLRRHTNGKLCVCICVCVCICLSVLQHPLLLVTNAHKHLSTDPKVPICVFAGFQRDPEGNQLDQTGVQGYVYHARFHVC